MKRLKKRTSLFLIEIASFIEDLFKTIAIIFILVGIILYATNIYAVKGDSMYPTLKDRDLVVTTIFKKSIYSLKHGDIISLKDPTTENSYLVKRVIAIPGDTITLHDGSVYINDKLLTESYLVKGTYTPGHDKLVVPKDHVFVMGDNRENSLDSRSFGPISIKSITSKVLFIKLY